ncbi:MAG: tetratricopeptide repeat protein [Tepidiphilus sp.]|jgi:tetratricopeptide (TPR) repeat protein|nr:tetratricopeptide repeat protein [Tepidiphilus sp.]MDD3434266.1 tetratricopeptide repeat protein [Tepidiphilus sp.]
MPCTRSKRLTLALLAAAWLAAPVTGFTQEAPALPNVATAATPEEAVRALQQQWEIANYQRHGKERSEALEALVEAARATAQRFPGRADVLTWEAICLASYAGSLQGLSQVRALGLAKEARERLEEAERLDPNGYGGAIPTTLGALYFQVPGWPLGFGDDEKAAQYLQKALTINPDGMDPNYFYGLFLMKKGEYAQAKTALEKALAAPPRPQRPLADEGRRKEIQAALQELERKQGTR